MQKYIISLLFVTGLAACENENIQATSPKEQVEDAARMCASNSADIKARQEKQSLYLRLGKKEGITEFSRNLYASHKANKNIGHMFVNVPEQPFITNVTDLVATASGGKEIYNGRDMPTVHKNMGITHQDFLDAGADVQSVLKDLGHGENEIQEVICMLVAQVPQVVNQ